MWEVIRKATSTAIGKAKKLTEKVGQALRLRQSEGADQRTREEMKADLAQAIGEAEQLMGQEDASLLSVRAELPVIQSKYRLASLELQQEDDEHYYVEGRVNPSAKSRIHRLGAVEVKRLEELLEGAEPTVAAF